MFCQKNFSAGEVCPGIYGASDTKKYLSGLATLRNWIVERWGSICTRPGFQYCTTAIAKVNAATGNNFVRLIPSIRDLTTTYKLELGHLYCRVLKNGQPVSVVGSPAWAANVYTPPGTVWQYNGGLGLSGYWYCISESMNPGTTTIAVTSLGGGNYTLTASTAIFAAIGTVGTWYAMHYGGQAPVAFLVTAYTDSEHVTATILQGTWPTQAAGLPITTWSFTVEPTSGHFSFFASPHNLEMVFPTPWACEDIQAIQFTQSVDVITLCHPNYAPVELTRSSDTAWALTTVATSANLPAPTALTAIAGLPVAGGVPAAPGGLAVSGGDTTATSAYYVAAFNSTIIGNISASVTNSKIADATHPMTISWSAVAGAVGYIVFVLHSTSSQICMVAQTTGLSIIDNGSAIGPIIGPSSISSTTATTYSYVVTAVDVNGNESAASAVVSCQGQLAWLTNNPPGQPPNTIGWAAVPGAVSYNVYREVTAGSGTYGLIGTATTFNGFNDDAITPDAAVSPPDVRTLFATATNYPSTATYYQQRYCFSCTLSQPDYTWMSRVGSYHDFGSSFPSASDDAVIFQLAGNRIQPIRHLVNVRVLLAFTDNGIYSIDGNQIGAITPANPGAQQENYLGCSALLRPIVVNNSALYLQVRGQMVRDVKFDLYTNGYLGTDISLFSQHLLDGYTLDSWTFAEIPNSIVWMVRSDGTLLGLTYSQEQQITGWHRHDTVNGRFYDVITVPEQVTTTGGQLDTVYAVVGRTILGQSRLFIERMTSRLVVDPLSDPQQVDCSVQYDGRNTTTATLTLSQTTGWALPNVITATASTTAPFAGAAAGSVFVLHDATGTFLIRLTVSAVVSSTVVTGTCDDTVPVALQNVATAIWSKGITTLIAQQLGGQAVSVFADGNELFWPDPSGESSLLQLDHSGNGQLGTICEVVTAGLPITCDIVTLNPDDPRPNQTSNDRLHQMMRLILTLDESSGVYAGQSFSASDLEPAPPLVPATFDSHNIPTSGIVNIEPRSTADYIRQICIRQAAPLPVRILQIAAHMVDQPRQVAEDPQQQQGVTP